MFAPQDAATLGNYASCLLSANRVTEGHAMLDRAIAALQYDFVAASHLADVWMYAVCHWLPERWTIALATLKKVLTMDKVTTGNWDFSGVIAAAIKRDHLAAAGSNHWLACALAPPPPRRLPRGTRGPQLKLINQ